MGSGLPFLIYKIHELELGACPHFLFNAAHVKGLYLAFLRNREGFNITL